DSSSSRSISATVSDSGLYTELIRTSASYLTTHGYLIPAKFALASANSLEQSTAICLHVHLAPLPCPSTHRCAVTSGVPGRGSDVSLRPGGLNCIDESLRIRLNRTPVALAHRVFSHERRARADEH